MAWANIFFCKICKVGWLLDDIQDRKQHKEDWVCDDCLKDAEELDN